MKNLVAVLALACLCGCSRADWFNFRYPQTPVDQRQAEADARMVIAYAVYVSEDANAKAAAAIAFAAAVESTTPAPAPRPNTIPDYGSPNGSPAVKAKPMVFRSAVLAQPFSPVEQEFSTPPIPAPIPDPVIRSSDCPQCEAWEKTRPARQKAITDAAKGFYVGPVRGPSCNCPAGTVCGPEGCSASNCAEGICTLPGATVQTYSQPMFTESVNRRPARQGFRIRGLFRRIFSRSCCH